MSKKGKKSGARVSPSGGPPPPPKGAQKAASGAAPSPSPPRKLSNLFLRVVSGVLMASGFALLCGFAGHLASFALVVVLEMSSFYELLNLRFKEAKEKEIPFFRTIQWLLFWNTSFYIYGNDVALMCAPYFAPLGILVRYHGYLSATMFILLFILFVMSLKKGYYRYQMGQLSWTCLSITIILIQSRSILSNILSGMIWFYLPAMLVILNDVWAFIGGKLLGYRIFKVNLIDLSPNKTWEGFYTGLLATPLFGLLVASICVKYPSMTCPFNNPGCSPSFPFLPVTYHLPHWLAVLYRSPTVTTLPFFIHLVFLSLFASICAPFGGFFASGVKRAYFMKDFGNVIPGHGGVMDRFDCQYMMAMYTTAHFTTFVKPYLKDNLVTKVMELFYQLKEADQRAVFTRISDFLKILG